ncbi:hypothetical protein [Tropicibacter sp. S64]|uniref:hypothetical protein n=1 Tax=Tropicibacter sp. S64 TaxID=3415122 RepID=UPI003C7C749A
MFSNLRERIVVRVVNAAKRGNPLARSLVARETRAFLRTLPVQSPIVPGPYSIPDLSRPLPPEKQNSLVGEYEQVALPPRPVSAQALVGRRVVSASVTLGTYGMGGYGFFGLQLEPEDWLVVPVFGAAEWITLDGRLLVDGRERPRRPPWIVDADDSAMVSRLAGAVIVRGELERHAFSLAFDNGAVLAIARDARSRPVMAGTEQPRVFLDSDDLSAALFFSPSAEVFA